MSQLPKRAWLRKRHIMKNQVQLIAYVDRFSGGGFGELNSLLKGPLAGVFGGAHLLPFFTPIDGADAGFDPIDHTQVDARLGTWEDVRALSGTVELVADLIVNHVSSSSPQFLDFSKKGPASQYAGMFLTFDRVFPEGARESDTSGHLSAAPHASFQPRHAALGREGNCCGLHSIRSRWISMSATLKRKLIWIRSSGSFRLRA